MLSFLSFIADLFIALSGRVGARLLTRAIPSCPEFVQYASRSLRHYCVINASESAKPYQSVKSTKSTKSTKSFESTQSRLLTLRVLD